MANAERFARLNADAVFHTPECGWLIWDGKRWCIDEQGQVMSILEEAYNMYGSTVSFLRVQEDGYQPEYFILVHSTGDLVRV